MERRRSERKNVSLETVLISGGKSYAGVAGNISEDGAYVRTSPTNTAIDFLPGTTLEMKFRIPSGETLNLHCEIIWLYTKKILPRRLKDNSALENDIGMKMKNSPPEYIKFVRNLQ